MLPTLRTFHTKQRLQYHDQGDRSVKNLPGQAMASATEIRSKEKEANAQTIKEALHGGGWPRHTGPAGEPSTK